MMKQFSKSIFVTLFIATNIIFVSQIAHADQRPRPDGRGPAGVMGDHTHKPGKLMLSYRYSRMKMEGNRSGSSDVSTEAVLENFFASPLKMKMDMHMLGVMYGLNERVTLMGMLSYMRKSMTLQNRMDIRFPTRAQGLGDIKLTAIYKLHSTRNDSGTQRSRLGLGLGLSLPTGDTDKRDDIPRPNGNGMVNIRLPYPMQLGSGTYDPMLSVTYDSFYPQWSWGAQFKTIQRLGKNDEGYRLGDEYHISSWAAYRYSNSLSTALRLAGKSWNNISGQDANLNPAMVPTARTDLRGGERVDLGISVNFLQTEGTFKGHRLAMEFLTPVYQHLDGPQLETDYIYTLGWQAMF